MTNSSSPARGRPSVLTPRLINRIERAVQAGKTRQETAEHVGVALSSLQRWLALGRKARANGVRVTGDRTLEQMALRLVLALDNGERKRQVLDAIASGTEPEPAAEPAAVQPVITIGRPRRGSLFRRLLRARFSTRRPYRT